MGPEQPLMIHGAEAAQIALCGEVISSKIEQHGTTYLSLKLDDGTGVVEVRKYFDQGDEEHFGEYEADYKQGSWYYVFGYLRSYQKRYWFSAFVLKKVSIDVVQIIVA